MSERGRVILFASVLIAGLLAIALLFGAGARLVLSAGAWPVAIVEALMTMGSVFGAGVIAAALVRTLRRKP